MSKKPNRLFYIAKLSSGLLKEFKNNLTLSFDELMQNGLIVSLADSQVLKTIRDITNHDLDRNSLEELFEEKDRLKKSKKITQYKKQRIKELQTEIYDTMYIPEIIVVSMDSKKDYEKLFKKGFILNGKLYKRAYSSPAQARLCTVTFIDAAIKEEFHRRLNCGRDTSKPLAPSKFSAYFSLSSSASKPVSYPRFCVVPDFTENMTHTVDFVIEKGYDEDDVIEERTITSEENRFDGSGLISPAMAAKWGEDLGEDYTPSNFCLRFAFTKGMVNTFDFIEWCAEYNNGNYLIQDIYGNTKDLREIDVILSESQVKLWNYWPSQEVYEQNAKECGFDFRITKYAPKQDKKVLWTNYQYLQTLDLKDEDIPGICQDTIKYIQGVTCSNIYYTILFLMGENMVQETALNFLKKSDNYWLKSLIINHNLINDKYSKEKIRDMIIRRIEQACLGRLIVKGNYECICPDPFAYMEWICYRDPTRVNGLLKEGEAYCNFWNENGNPTKVDSMRSPLTHFSEHGINTIVNTPEMQKWYKYCYSGYINNTHDEFTYIHAGSDWDYDIIASTDNQYFVNNTYPNQKIVTYNVKKPKKKLFTEEDLFITDTFSFGNAIGQITNTCSSICARMAEFTPDSKEYKLLSDRLKAGCAAQSRQIDKTKIGEDVKTLSTTCRQYQHINPDDTEEEKAHKTFLNSILVDKKPYFFKYKYKSLAKEIREYDNKTEDNCGRLFNMTFSELLSIPSDSLTTEQADFIWYYHKYYPALESDCAMNKICKYIESVDFEIKKKVRTSADFNYKNLMSGANHKRGPIYDKIKVAVEESVEEWKAINKAARQKKLFDSSDEQIAQERDTQCKILKSKLLEICPSEEMLTDFLVYLFYVDKKSYSKSTLWALVGKQMYENTKNNCAGDGFLFPVRNDEGSLEFLYDKFEIQWIEFEQEEVQDGRLDG